MNNQANHNQAWLTLRQPAYIDNGDWWERMIDVLTDLMHFAHVNQDEKRTFSEALRFAARHFEHEAGVDLPETALTKAERR